MSVSRITMKDLYEQLGKLGPGEVILDVQGQEEFKSGHVHGSINIPHDQIANQAEKLKSYSKIYIHCQAGRRAEIAADVLSRLGLTNLVCVSGSGMADWLAAGLPFEK